MKHEDSDFHMKREKQKRGEGRKDHHHGAQTFRRGRAIDFLERLTLKRMTLRQQLVAPEFQEIKQIILGELKAIEMVIDEFIKQFELHEIEQIKKEGRQKDGEEQASE